MKTLSILLLVMSASVFGPGSSGGFAQASSESGPPTEKLPADVDPVTRNRMPPVKRDQFTADDDKEAFDRLVKAEPRFGKPQTGGTGIRLHMPVAADAYRVNLGNLRDKSGVEQKYQELAVMVASRENNGEYEWSLHEKNAAKLNSPEIIEIIRNKQEPKGLGEKETAIIRFGREMHGKGVSSETYADMQRLFGPRGTLGIALTMIYYEGNALLFRAYNQKVDADKKRPFPDVVAMEAKGR